MASPKMTLKLLVDKKASRVLFAEVPKEFVDFLFHIFSLPLGTLIEFIGSKQMVGCLGKLKDTIESFNGNYLQPGIKNDDIFNPKTPFNTNTFLLSYDHASSADQSAGASKAVYKCSNATTRCSYCSNQTCRSTTPKYKKKLARPYSKVHRDEGCGTESCCSNVTLCENTICPDCSGSINVKMTLVMPNEVEETKEDDKRKNKGYVKDVMTYIVMDDLEVQPMFTISSITLMNKLGVKDLSQLEEMMVSFGVDEGLKLLMASLKTDKVLTTIFFMQ